MKRRIFGFGWFFGLSWLLLVGCASAPVTKDDEGQVSYLAEFQEPSQTKQRPLLRKGLRNRVMKPQTIDAAVGSEAFPEGRSGLVSASMDEDEAPSSVDSSPRMVFHEGHLVLKSVNPAKTLDSAVLLAQSFGGFLESREGAMVVLRIPADTFRVCFDRFAALGTLVSKNLRSDDITTQFQETALRLRVARETLERLQTLLSESRDANEKIRLLREIQRLSEQIKRMEAQSRELEKKSQFSRLTLSVLPFVFRAEDSEEPIAVFRWIHQLNPLRLQENAVSVTVSKSRPLRLAVPLGFVDLKAEDSSTYWCSVSGDGSELWARRMENEPRGNATFWAEAIRLRLQEPFAKTEVLPVGTWMTVKMTSHGDCPYVWWVSVRILGGELQVSEAFFPDLAALSTHAQAVLAVLEAKP